MANKNIEFIESGLQCDNPKCDWIDSSITFENYHNWLNKPCPKCGENVLTQNDYINAEILHKTIEFINTLSESELDEFNKTYDGKIFDNLKNFDNPMFKDTKGLNNLKIINGSVNIVVSTHKEIKIDEIKNID